MQNIFKDSAEYCKILAAPQSLSLNDEPSITAPLFLLLFTSATRSLSKGFTPLNPLNSSPGKVSRFYPFKCHPLLLDHLMLNQPILRPLWMFIWKNGCFLKFYLFFPVSCMTFNFAFLWPFDFSLYFLILLSKDTWRWDHGGFSSRLNWNSRPGSQCFTFQKSLNLKS